MIKSKVEHGFKAYLYSFIYPFTQKDWPQKMWLFVVLSYIPVINIIIARGWRLEFVHRLGHGFERPLPGPRDVFKFFKNGLLLWLVTGFFLLLPVVIISKLGLGGFREFVRDIIQLLYLCWDLIRGNKSLSEFFAALGSFTKNELLESFGAFMIENIYLIIYLPLYRIGMIRFALTKNLLASLTAVGKNLRFIFNNFLEVVLLYAFFLLEFLVVLLVDFILALSVIGIPLIPIVTVYMYYWSTGYEYGHIARLMVEQEKGLQTQQGAIAAEVGVEPPPPAGL